MDSVKKDLMRAGELNSTSLGKKHLDELLFQSSLCMWNSATTYSSLRLLFVGRSVDAFLKTDPFIIGM